MIVTLAQRKAKIKSVTDIDIQLARAKTYAKELRNKAKRAPSLAEKLALDKDRIKAEEVLKKLRLESFAIEDELIAQEKNQEVNV
jgi:hypothetical protein